MGFLLLNVIYALLGITLQTTWLFGVPTHFIQFDFIIIAVAGISFYQYWQRAIPVLVVLGILNDSAMGLPFGLSIMSYVIIYFCIRAIIAKISLQVGLGLLFWVGVISVLDKMMIAISYLLMDGHMLTANIIFKRMPMQAVLDALLAIALLPLLKKYWQLSWEKITRPKGIVLK